MNVKNVLLFVNRLPPADRRYVTVSVSACMHTPVYEVLRTID